MTIALGANSANAQDVSFKNFASFQNIVPGVIDFFASDRKTIAPYEEAAAEAVAKLKTLFGEEIPKGAIFICTNQAQRDSLYEPVVMRQGYSWVLVSVSQEAQAQEMLERIKAQMGDNIPDEIRQRINNMPQNMASNMDRQVVTAVVRNIAFAVTQTMMNDESFQFRTSRVDDVGKSPLQDWLDIGISVYASGDKRPVAYLRENLDMAFPLEDVLFMARPFVASAIMGQRSSGGGGGRGGVSGNGQGMPQIIMGGGQGGQRQGTAKSKPGGGSGPQQREMSKDEQDQMLFDGQAIAFFDYFMEKFGIGKMRELIEFVREKNESWDYVVRPDMLGRDFTKIESDLNEWLAKQSIPDPKPKSKVQQ
jgi:hypothetical protein